MLSVNRSYRLSAAGMSLFQPCTKTRTSSAPSTTARAASSCAGSCTEPSDSSSTAANGNFTATSSYRLDSPHHVHHASALKGSRTADVGGRVEQNLFDVLRPTHKLPMNR